MEFNTFKLYYFVEKRAFMKLIYNLNISKSFLRHFYIKPNKFVARIIAAKSWKYRYSNSLEGDYLYILILFPFAQNFDNSNP